MSQLLRRVEDMMQNELLTSILLQSRLLDLFSNYRHLKSLLLWLF